jgi:hypothetical protein
MADATALEDFSVSFLSSGDGDAPSPAGVEMLSEKIKSSRFIASGFSAGAEGVAVFWSELVRSKDIPLGPEFEAFEVFCLDNL